MEHEFKDMSAEQITNMIAHGLWELIQDEAEANAGYEKFLAKCGAKLTSKQKGVIVEHIRDEYAHAIELQELFQDITGIKPAKN